MCAWVVLDVQAGILQAADRGRRHVSNMYDPGFDKGWVVHGNGEGPKTMPRADMPFGSASEEGRTAWQSVAIGPVVRAGVVAFVR